jgi:hypothetical protein
MEEILKIKESGLNFQNQGHMKTSVQSKVFRTEIYLNTRVLYVILDSKHEASGKMLQSRILHTYCTYLYSSLAAIN